MWSTLRSAPPTCTVCRRPISVTALGLVRLHGPVVSRCPGSRQAPINTAQPYPTQPRGHDAVRSASPQSSGQLSDSLPSRNYCKIIKRIPKNSRERAGRKLASILNAVVAINDHSSWDRLLRFGGRCLRVPSNREGRRKSVTTALNIQIEEETDPPDSQSLGHGRSRSRTRPQDPTKGLAARVSAKLEEGDFRGAVRLACSEDSVADMSPATFAALQERHPPPHPHTAIPPPIDSANDCVAATPEAVASAIRSFPNGSAGGPDGLRPQHLKDLTGPSGATFSLWPLPPLSTLSSKAKPHPPYALSFLELH